MMLRIHCLQQWLGLSDPAIEEALHDTSLYCEFARLESGAMRLPDENTILRFRHLLDENNLGIQLLSTSNATRATKGLMLDTGTVVDATPSCTEKRQWCLADADCQGATKRPAAMGVHWHTAVLPGKCRALDKRTPWGNLLDKAALNLGENALVVSSDDFLTFNSRYGRGCADLP